MGIILIAGTFTKCNMEGQLISQNQFEKSCQFVISSSIESPFH